MIPRKTPLLRLQSEKHTVRIVGEAVEKTQSVTKIKGNREMNICKRKGNQEMEGREKKRRKRKEKGIKCIYQLPTMNGIIAYCQHVLAEPKVEKNGQSFGETLSHVFVVMKHTARFSVYFCF